MAPIGVAVVGLGVIGKTHVKVLKELERDTGVDQTGGGGRSG